MILTGSGCFLPKTSLEVRDRTHSVNVVAICVAVEDRKYHTMAACLKVWR